MKVKVVPEYMRNFAFRKLRANDIRDPGDAAVRRPVAVWFGRDGDVYRS